MGDGTGSFELGRDGPRSVLVGVDGTRNSLRAAAYAAGLARRQECRLTVVHVRTLNPMTALAPEVWAEQSKQDDGIEAGLRAEQERSAWQVDVEFVTRNGDPAHVLAEVAQETSAGLIVLGSTRPGAMLRSGRSVAKELIRIRRWPVLVVP